MTEEEEEEEEGVECRPRSNDEEQQAQVSGRRRSLLFLVGIWGRQQDQDRRVPCSGRISGSSPALGIPLGVAKIIFPQSAYFF